MRSKIRTSLKAIKYILMLALLFVSQPCHAAAFELFDVALLFPGEHPEQMLDLRELPWLAASFPSLMAQLYGGSAATKRVAARTEVAPRLCLQSQRSWKLVAVRLDPFATVALGSVRWLDARATFQPGLEHRRVPQLRLTFQPFCSNEPVATDAALHLSFEAFRTEAEAAEHEHLWRTLRDSVDRRLSRRAVQDSEARYLSWLNAPERAASTAALVRACAEFRDRRAGRMSAVWPRHLEHIFGVDGTIALTPTGEPDGALTHPLLSGPGAAGTVLIRALLAQHARRAKLHDIGLMATGDGQLTWFFSVAEPQAQPPFTHERPVHVYRTDRGLPRLAVDLGNYDFQSLEGTQAYQQAALADRRALARENMLRDGQEGQERAAEAWQQEQELMDPLFTGHSTQTCFGCHESQERATMALRASQGAAPREFGYVFRSFGYHGKLPIVTRRLALEAAATVRALNAWQTLHNSP